MTLEFNGTGWWDEHDAASQRARRLFAIMCLTTTLYFSGIVTIVVLAVAAIATGDGDVVAEWVDDLGILGTVAMAVGLFVVASLAIAVVGWSGTPRRTRRLSRARTPQPLEVVRVQGMATAFALAYGIRNPTIWVIDDPAPNALGFGRRSSGHVGITTGALELPPSALETLVMFQISALASRAFSYAMAAVDLVLLAEWTTRVLWASAIVALLSTVVGVPIEVAAVYVVAAAVVVAVTRPLMMFARRELVALLDDVDALVDLETIRQSNEPAAFARLLLTLIEDDLRVLQSLADCSSLVRT